MGSYCIFAYHTAAGIRVTNYMARLLGLPRCRAWRSNLRGSDCIERQCGWSSIGTWIKEAVFTHKQGHMLDGRHWVASYVPVMIAIWRKTIGSMFDRPMQSDLSTPHVDKESGRLILSENKQDGPTGQVFIHREKCKLVGWLVLSKSKIQNQNRDRCVCT